jgi:hypothetical protein
MLLSRCVPAVFFVSLNSIFFWRILRPTADFVIFRPLLGGVLNAESALQGAANQPFCCSMVDVNNMLQ